MEMGRQSCRCDCSKTDPPLSLLSAMLGVAAMCSFIYSHAKSGIVFYFLCVLALYFFLGPKLILPFWKS